MKLFEMVSAPAIGTYWTEVNSNRVPYLGETLWDNDKKTGLDLSFIKGHRGLPVALKPSAFDAKAPIRDRIGLERIETEMPLFREGMKIQEKERQELLKLQEASPVYYQEAIKNIYDDRSKLIDGALVQAERMRMQLLYTGGKIYISSNGLLYEYDFDQTGEYAAKNTMTLSGSDMWTDHENSRPIEDLQNAMKAVEERYGTRPTRAIMTLGTWANLLMNKSIRMDMNVLNGDKIILTDNMLEQYLLSKIKLQVAVYNKMYQDEQGAEGTFYKDGCVSLIPGTKLGKTWYGTTPEEADLLSGGTDAEVQIVDKGIAVTTFKEVHPVNVNTVVSSIMLPSFERMNETFLMKVY